MTSHSPQGEQDRAVRRFDAADTDACKGVALVLLLWHHLFYLHPEYGFLVRVTSLAAKVCVAIFVLLSGYGLAASVAARTVGLLSFYKDRLSRLYLNYWLVAALFIAFGTLTGLRPVAAAYPTHPYLYLAVQLAALDQFLVGGFGYNATWWFMGLIVPLYVLFPFLNDLTRKYGWWFLSLCSLLLIGKGIRILMLQEWLFPFCLGIYAAQRNSIASTSSGLSRLGMFRFALLGALLVAAAYLKLVLLKGGVQTDGLFGALVIVSTFEATRTVPALKKILGFLGRHLFNIFLFHTFIYFYFWPEVIYAPRNPLVILVLLLGVCLVVSLALEKVKSLVGLPRLQAAIDRVRVPAAPLL